MMVPLTMNVNISSNCNIRIFVPLRLDSSSVGNAGYEDTF